MNEVAQIRTQDLKLVQPDPPEFDRDYYGPVDEDPEVGDQLEESDEDDYYDGESHLFSGLMSLAPKRDNLFMAGLIIALLLHLGLFALSQRTSSFMPPKTPLKAGERLQQVRLVELNQPKTKEEPPPEKASAISDRDHTAERIRLPKRPTTPPKPPRVAALQAPKAPEVFEEPKKPAEPVEKEIEDKRTKAPEKEKEPRTEAPLNESMALEKMPDPTKKREDEKPKAVSRLDPMKTAVKKGLNLKPTWEELSKGVAAASRPSDYFEEGMVEEAVVDINTREERFYSYLLHLKRKIEGVWVYPRVAAKGGVGGSLTLEFLIAKDGSLMGVNLLDSSGHTVLDEYALRAIKSAAPYHPFPARLKAKRLRIRANFVYLTSRHYRRMM